MNNFFLTELERERAEIESLIQQCYAEIKACRVIYEATGDGSAKWRSAFDQRWQLMRELAQINAQIEAARREILAVGSTVVVYFNDQPSGRTTVQAIHPTRHGGRIVSVAPLTPQAYPLAFSEDGRCVIRGFEDFTFRPAALEAA